MFIRCHKADWNDLVRHKLVSQNYYLCTNYTIHIAYMASFSVKMCSIETDFMTIEPCENGRESWFIKKYL